VDIDKATLDAAPVYTEGAMEDSDWRAVDTHYNTRWTKRLRRGRG
jgi:hypothetical protein